MMENILVNVLDRPGGPVIYEGKYRPGVKAKDLLTTLRATYRVGFLKNSAGFDIVDSDGVLMPGLYSYVRIATTGLKVDYSRTWSQVMLLDDLPELPQNANSLQRILFPEQNGRLPVSEEVYNIRKVSYSETADDYLVQADGSQFCNKVSQCLQEIISVDSELDVSFFVGGNIKSIFKMLDRVSPLQFVNEVLLNQRETSSTGKRTRPDTLVIADDCLFLVGDHEDKESRLYGAGEDLRVTLSPVFYGPVKFILGYMAAGTTFQWVYLGKDKEMTRLAPILDLYRFADRCRFLLSVGYAYKLIRKMAESVPHVPGRRAMFSLEVNMDGDRTLEWFHNSVRKTVKDFSGHCETCLGSSLEVIKKAYDVARECKFLAQAKREPKLLGSSYSVEIGPLGCSVRLRCEQDCKQFAQNVCQALAVLHRNGLVHRDVRLPNVVKVFNSEGDYYFMLIDLETVADADFVLSEGFDSFRYWTDRTLEGSRYTPMSDMYHLGEILRDKMWDPSPLAMKFLNELTAEELDAEMALRHPWLTGVEL